MSTASNAQPRSTWLRIARVAWVTLALIYFINFFVAFPYAYAANLEVCQGEVCTFTQLNAEEIALLESRGISHELYAGFQTFSEVLLLTWGLLGVFVFLRMSDQWIGLLTSMALISIGIFGLSDNSDQLIKGAPDYGLFYNTLSAFGGALVVLMVVVFPDGRFVPNWSRYVVIPLVAAMLVDPLLADVVPPLENAPGTTVFLLALLSGLLIGTFAQIQRYRNYSNLEQRQQTKWVGVGFLALLLTAIFWSLYVEFFPLPPGPLRLTVNVFSFPIFLSLLLVLPITMTISILRYRLFDIDVIIKRTLVYGALSIAIVVIYFAAVVVLQGVFRAMTGQGDQLAIVASTLLIAALFNPLRGRIQTAVNRRFFRGDYNAAQMLSAFAESVQDEVDLEPMLAALLATVEKTMQPSKVSLWLKED